jgi:hypothetical protein
MPEPEYSPEIIHHYHELEAGHGFHRAIQERRPVGLEDDLVTLACGHQVTMNHREVDLVLEAANRFSTPVSAGGVLRCQKCARAWLKENIGRGPK